MSSIIGTTKCGKKVGKNRYPRSLSFLNIGDNPLAVLLLEMVLHSHQKHLLFLPVVHTHRHLNIHQVVGYKHLGMQRNLVRRLLVAVGRSADHILWKEPGSVADYILPM